MTAFGQTNAVSDAARKNEAKLFGKTVTISKEGGDLSDEVGAYSRKQREKSAVVVPHAPEDVFIRMDGQVLTWGRVDEYIDQLLKVSPLSLPPQATPEEIEKIVASARMKAAEMAANMYIRDWILVPEARAHGVSVSDAEIQAALSNSVQKVSKKHRKDIFSSIQDKESFFYRNQVGYLITKKYIDEVLVKEITVSDAEIEAAIAERQSAISQAKEYNATLRPKMEGWLAEIKAGTRDFGETAFEFSDCGSSVDNGEWEEFEAADNSLLEPLREFVFAASTNELSEVIETPYSFHIVKILKRNYDYEVEEP